MTAIETQRPTIELKKIKHAAFASEETPCYSAEVFVDGKKFATVSNDGRGGCDRVSADGGYDAVRALNERIGGTFPKLVLGHGLGEIEETLETVCHRLLDEHLIKASWTRRLKTQICAVSSGKMYTWPKKFPPTKENLDRWKVKFAANNTLLNELPMEEALALLLKTEESGEA